MSNSAPHDESAAVANRWLRDIHRYEHTIVVDESISEGNKDSWCHFLDRAFITEAGEYIGDKPEVRAIAKIWYGANQFHQITSDLKYQAEQTCNVIAALEGVRRHDVVLDDETWEIVANMQSGSREAKVLISTMREIEAVLERMKHNASRVRGVFRPAHKDKIEGRLNRAIAEQEAMLSSFRGIIGELSLPQTAYEVRQYILSQLILQVDLALEILTPLRRELKDTASPEDFRKRIFDNEATFFRARSQLKKWRDNPSQKFGAKVKEMCLLLLKTNKDTVLLKDDSFHAISKLGARFYTRCGRATKPKS